MVNRYIEELIVKSMSQNLNTQESEELLVWVNESEENKQLYAAARDLYALSNISKQKNYATSKAYRKILTASIKRRNRVVKLMIGCAAAVIAGFVLPFWLESNKDTVIQTELTSGDVVLMFGDATYSLGENATIDDIKKVVNLAAQPINKTSKTTKIATINRIIVPRGRTCDIELPDGSTVSLNSLSELAFPSFFSDTLREVRLIGEATFNIKKSESVPFIVKTKHGITQVLGTYFNISAYPTDSLERISLISGVVKAVCNGHECVLSPGQQAVISENATEIKVVAYNADETLAWKESMFIFDDKTLCEITSVVERWYDAEFEFTYENLKNIKAYVKIKRSRSLNEFLDALASTNKVRFKQQGDKIYITPRD